MRVISCSSISIFFIAFSSFFPFLGENFFGRSGFAMADQPDHTWYRVANFDGAAIVLNCNLVDRDGGYELLWQHGRYEFRRQEHDSGYLVIEGQGDLDRHFRLFVGEFCSFEVFSDSWVMADWIGSSSSIAASSVTMGDGTSYTVPDAPINYSSIIQHIYQQCENAQGRTNTWPFDAFQPCSFQVQNTLETELIVLGFGGDWSNHIALVAGHPFVNGEFWEGENQ